MEGTWKHREGTGRGKRWDASVLDALRHGEIVAWNLVPWGSNDTFGVAIAAPGRQDPVAAIYKPRQGEAPLWDFPDGTLYLREYAAYRTARALGWDFIPPTVVREGPYGIGVVQLFIEHDPEQHYFALREEEGYRDQFQRIALFDWLVNNADRKAGHCLLGSDGKVWAIDHGLTFHVVPKLRTVIWDFAGEPVPQRLLDDVSRLLRDADRTRRLVEDLRHYLDPSEIEAFFQRAHDALRRGHYPRLDPRRNVPWPLV